MENSVAKTVEDFFNENNVRVLKPKSKSFIKTFAQFYSEALAGATPSTISKRLLTYTIKKDKETGVFIGEHVEDRTAVPLFQTFFESFDKELSSALRCKEHYGILALELEEPVTNYLKNSTGTVYYLAGWLLYKMRVFMKRRSCLYWKEILQCIISNNTTDVPMIEERLLNIREKQDGKLQRVNKEFYEFTAYMEALWLMNLNSTVASVFKGDVFSIILRRVIGSSKELRRHFQSCLPKDLVSSKSKPLIDELYLMVINAYASLRASDTIRRVKQRKLKDGKI